MVKIYKAIIKAMRLWKRCILEEIEEETGRSHPGLGSLLRLFLFVCLKKIIFGQINRTKGWVG